MAETPVEMPFTEVLEKWRGKLSLKEAAGKLGIDYPSMRKYACGKRTPHKLIRAELQRRMQENPQ